MQTVSTALRNAIDAGNPQRVLLDFNGQTFSNEDISLTAGVELTEEFNSEKNLAIGLTPSRMISFTMLNDTNQLANFGFGWFTAYLGARIDSGTPTERMETFTEKGQTVTDAFSKLGVFYAERPDVIAKKTISVTAYDQMILLDKDMPTSASLSISYPTTIGTIFSKICQGMGITGQSGSFLNDGLEVAEEPDAFKQATVRKVIGWIAECACSNALFNREGTLEFSWFSSTGKS